MGATTSIVVPWLVDRLYKGVTWQAMARWIHDHLPHSELQFFSEARRVQHQLARAGGAPNLDFCPAARAAKEARVPDYVGDHSDQYRSFPKLLSSSYYSSVGLTDRRSATAIRCSRRHRPRASQSGLPSKGPLAAMARRAGA
jgi:hypothetical protein